jgi:hypothetical protein
MKLNYLTADVPAQIAWRIITVNRQVLVIRIADHTRYKDVVRALYRHCRKEIISFHQLTTLTRWLLEVWPKLFLTSP